MAKLKKKKPKKLNMYSVVKDYIFYNKELPSQEFYTQSQLNSVITFQASFVSTLNIASISCTL